MSGNNNKITFCELFFNSILNFKIYFYLLVFMYLYFVLIWRTRSTPILTLPNQLKKDKNSGKPLNILSKMILKIRIIKYQKNIILLITFRNKLRVKYPGAKRFI